MDARRNLLARLMAGLQVGILGGLVTLVWFAVLSQLQFRAPWTLLNLFGSTLGGNPHWGFGLSWATLTGAALHLFACGAFGMLIGWLLPRPSEGSRYSVAGAAFGALLSLMVYEFFWRRQFPRLNTFVASGGILLVHLIMGAAFSNFPRFFLRLAEPDPTPAADEIS